MILWRNLHCFSLGRRGLCDGIGRKERIAGLMQGNVLQPRCATVAHFPIFCIYFLCPNGVCLMIGRAIYLKVGIVERR